MICILKALAGYLILLFVGTNLLGFIVRSFFPPTYTNDTEIHFLNEEIRKLKRAATITTILFSIITISYFYALYYFWNIGIVIVAAILMLSRIPDLLFEIKTGKKVTFKTMPKTAIDVLCTILFWIALPLLWYSLCYLK